MFHFNHTMDPLGHLSTTSAQPDNPSSLSSSSTISVLLRESVFSVTKDSGIADLSDWTICVHSQGWIYFYNASLHVVTDQDIRRPETLKITEELCTAYPLSDLSAGMEVQISMGHNTASGSSCGLFNIAVNHIHCVASYDLPEVKGDNPLTLNPKRLNRCRRLYWNYLWNHPVHVPAPLRALEDASDALTWFYTDNLISGARSRVPFSKAECEELSRIVAELALPRNDKSIAKTIFLSWLLREVCSFRDAENWGQNTHKESQNAIKLNRNPALTRPLPHPIIMILISFIIKFLFFGIPHTYQAHIKLTSEYRGRLANMNQNWINYVERLVREYSHFLLISTVLLSATVGFLAIPNIPEGAQVAATISTFASLGSIIIGVFSIWRHQGNTTTADSFTYLHNVRHGFLGLSGHAMLLSLPPVLLVWAILLFTLSVIVFVMNGIGDDTATWHKVSVWSVFIIFLILLLVVALALYTFSIIWKFQRQTVDIWKRFGSIVSKGIKSISDIV